MRMRSTITILTLVASIIGCNKNEMTSKEKTAAPVAGHADINGISMYYEIYGEGKPLVLLHGAGSTIGTTFGRIIPYLQQHRRLIAVELQAHGRTSDRDKPISFEQDADDVAALLAHLKMPKADFLGFSNGGTSVLQIAIRHPEICDRVVAASALLKRDGTMPQFWEFMKQGTLEQMPGQYKEAFLEVTPDSARLYNMFRKCADRMINFQDVSDEALKSIKCPVLLVNGDHDVATSGHMVAMSHIIPDCSLAILPGAHGEYMGELVAMRSNQELTVLPVLKNFLGI